MSSPSLTLIITSLTILSTIPPLSHQQHLSPGLPDALFYLISPFIQTIDFTSQESCEPEIGCFRKDGPYINPIHRPVNVIPQSRRQVNTQFYLYTRRNVDRPEHIRIGDVRSLSRSSFRSKSPTKILIHGYLYNHLMGKYQQDAFRRLIRAFLLAGDYNVILADWGDGATTWYFQASANSRVVGREIALLLKFLNREAGVPFEDFHVIGHSLGAHIAGLAGQDIPRLGRITGLDPAKPYFEATHHSIRLDSTDALYVDVLHTDASLNGNDMFSLGTRQLMGDVDFFPNNGDRQPRCPDEVMSNLLSGNGLITAAQHLMTCDHRRSVDLLANYLEESRTRRCIPLAYRCSSWRAYESGQCFSCGANGQNCAIVGEPRHILISSKSEKKTPFYIKTSVRSPLCAFQYRVEFSLSDGLPPMSSILIELEDNKGIRTAERTREGNWKGGVTYAFVIASASRLGVIEKVRMSSDMTVILAATPSRLGQGVRVSHLSVTPMNEWSDSLKAKKSVRFCHFIETARKGDTSRCG